VRAAAAYLLARGGWAKASREALIEALEDPDPFVRVEAVRAMAADTVVTPLKKALGHRDPRVREAGVKALGSVRGPAAVRALARAVRDADPDVGFRAAAVLGGFQTRSVPAILGEALRERGPASRVRRRLIRSLEALEGREAVPDLLAVLVDPDLEVRGEAALVLGDWKVRGAIPELIRLVEEGLDAQQARAHRCLVRMTGTDHGYGTPEAREKWEAWWEGRGGR
jgi:HEAT repeat protein